MHKIISILGLICFALWNWWFLQWAVIDYGSNSRHKLSTRLFLGVILLLLFFWPIPMVRIIKGTPGMAVEIALLGCYVMQVMGLWHGCLAAVLCLWGWLAPKRLRFRPWKQGVACLAGVFLLAVVGFWQAGHSQIKRHDVTLDNLPENADGYRVMLLSDLHLTHFYRKSILTAVESAIASEHPNIIVHCGDLLDGPMSGDVSNLAERVATWSVPDGKFAVFGNHDGYGGLGVSMPLHEKCGFRLLSDLASERQVSPQPWLTLTGIDDPMIFMRPHFQRQKADGDADGVAYIAKDDAYVKAVANIPPPIPGNVNIVLCHQPGLSLQVPEGYDVMLAGHTHGGQIFPFNFVVNMTNGFRTSHWYSLRTRMLLYICRGTGFWGPPFRLLVPSEITVITFRRTK